MKNWQIQEVKQRLSEVIKLALTSGPQKVTNRGEPSVWIISNEEYTRFVRQKESIVDFFQNSPHRNLDLALERKKDLPRKIDL